MTKKIKPELLAPAGNMVCLRTALQAGADAVYFGVGNDLNMRVAANNFTTDHLAEIREECDNYSAKAYLTMNTIAFDGEMAEIERILDAAKGKVDAVICWDFAVIQRVLERDIPLHISTQASIANSDSAGFFKALGAERIVAARECSLEQLVDIRKNSGVEVEVFIHGAMCVSVSGRCFLSQFLTGKSGNRGACHQQCRREYKVTDVQTDDELVLGHNYVMSAKDLCVMPFLEKVLATGVESLKIEGRNRTPEYVQRVVGCYRQALDLWEKDELTKEIKEDLYTQLKEVYNREFSSGFFLGQPIDEFTPKPNSLATREKAEVGKVSNWFNKAGIAEIHIQNYSFSVGDELSFQGYKTGTLTVIVDEIWQDDKPVQTAERGFATMKLSSRVRTNDRVYRFRDREDQE